MNRVLICGCILFAVMVSFRASAQNTVAPDKTVRDFGAVGDGKADDTAALQRAVDSGGGDIRIPSGVYRITRAVVIDLDKAGPVSISGGGTARLVMAGAGPAIRLVGTHGGTADPRTVKPNVWSRQRMPLVDALEIVGAHPESAGIDLTGTMKATLTRILIREVGNGIRLTGRNRNVIISDCHIYSNRGYGILLDQAELHQINIADCHVSYNERGGIASLNSVIRNLQIGTCDIEANVSAQAQSPANVLIDATGGSVVEGALVGCTLQHSSASPDTANVRIVGESREKSGRAGNFTIADNVLSDVAVNIHLKHARGVTVTGNTFWQASRYNLLVEGSSHIVVGPNLFDRSPHYSSRDPDAILFRDSEECTLTGLHIKEVLSAPAALVIQNCRWFNVNGCTILDAEGAGLLLDNSEHCLVTGCLIRGRGTGKVAVKATGGKGNVISGNFLAGPVRIEGGGAQARNNTEVD